MKISHIHLTVRDLQAAIKWFEQVLDVRPGFQDQHMAELGLGDLGVVLDAGDRESAATIGLASDDCDADYTRLRERGAEVVEAPADRSWGVRAAYLRGPGAITFEIDQPLN